MKVCVAHRVRLFVCALAAGMVGCASAPDIPPPSPQPIPPVPPAPKPAPPAPKPAPPAPKPAPKPAPPVPKPEAKPAPRPEAISNVVTVHFGTTREYAYGRFESARRGTNPPLVYPIRFGTVDVHFERLPDPSGLGTNAVREIARLFAAECSFLDYATVVQRPRIADPEDFWKSLEFYVQSTDGYALIIYIHGFNNSFDEAAARAAVLSRKLRAPAAFFSWPSRESIMGYNEDAAMIERMKTPITRFVRHAIESSKAERVLLIAHSMGSRALLHALSDLMVTPPRNKVRQYDVVFAAPDVGAEQFRAATGKLVNNALSMTVYGSQYDEPLQISKWVNRDEGLRAGDVAAFDTIVSSSLIAIDASRAAAEMVGHSYFVNSSAVLNDIFGLFRRPEQVRSLPVLRTIRGFPIYEVR